MTRVVCAPDKLRGALDAFAAAAALAEGVSRAGAEPVTCALADGGEGTLAVVCAAGAAERIEVDAHDALGRPLRAAIGDCGGGTFLVEAAEAVGLGLLVPRERDPRRTGSAGLADLLRAALERGATRVLVGLGGSATVDGGLGMLAGLGARGSGSDRRGAARRPRPGSRARASALRRRRAERPPRRGRAALRPGWRGRAVRSPEGPAARGHQAVRSRAGTPRTGVRRRHRAAPGSGRRRRARCCALCPRSGFALGLRRRDRARRAAGPAPGAALCLTAEGSVDRQSARGKTVAGVLAACRDAGVPCIVLGGKVSAGSIEPLRALGALDVLAIGPPGRRLDVALAMAADELATAAERAVARV